MRIAPWISAFVLLFAAALPAAERGADPRPNIVLMLVDDWGWTDMSCAGSKFYETPHIDRLAADGMRFMQAYSACTVCSPSRAAVLTGQYPARLHITDWIAGHVRTYAKLRVPDWTQYLSHDVPNLARSLKQAGYATGHFGKWHLGKEAYFPETQGFDVNVAGTHAGSPPSYFSPYKNPKLKDGPAGEFLSDRLASEACQFIEQHQGDPFFVYLPHFGVRTPLMSKPDVRAKYAAKVEEGAGHRHAVYAGLLESVDDALGTVVATLDRLKLSERTIVLLTSDNGGLLGSTSNAPLCAGKGFAYEGGVRVPLIIKWPGVVTAGSTCNVPVMGIDYYPTLLAAAGVQPAAGQTIDGVNILPLLKQTGTLDRDTLYWHYPHYHPGTATPYSAIRQGDWRLVEFYEDGHIELYNLRDDLGETHDLAAARPAEAAALRAKLDAWRKARRAQAPTPNPDHDPTRDGKKK